jgi:hypothetical protein
LGAQCPVSTVATIQEFLVAMGMKLICNPPYFLDLASADYFLFPEVKSELAGRTLAANAFKNNL